MELWSPRTWSTTNFQTTTRENLEVKKKKKKKEVWKMSVAARPISQPSRRN
jgi:hypothetical protein